MTTPAQEAYEQSGTTPAVRWLIALNVGVYFVQYTVVGAIPSYLGLQSSNLPESLWTLATYMFVHAGLLHLGVNMLTLWMFGPKVESSWSTRGFVYFYLWCGLGGAIFHLLLVRNGVLVGASAAIMGVMLAYATRWPDDEVYIFGVVPMKARWLIVWMIVINLGMGIMDGDGGGIAWFAHLGGLVFGWLYLHGPSGGSFERIRQAVAAVPDDGDEPPHPVPRTARRRPQPIGIDDIIAAKNAEAESGTQTQTAPGSAVTRRRTLLPSVMPGLSAERAAEMNAVLDKISRDGMASLTTDEKRLLEEMSRRLKDP
jgi:membrane associated rhomboid family serine protease